MQQRPQDQPFDADQEYRTIEAALLQNARGRWFLAEHGRRARRLDSALLEEAIGRLQSSLRQPPALLHQLRSEIEGLRELLAQTRLHLLAKPESQPAGVTPTQPTDGILRSAEELHALAWRLHGDAARSDPAAGESIARHAAHIYALSVQHAVTAQRNADLLAAVDEASLRLAALLETIAHESAGEGVARNPALLDKARQEIDTLALLAGDAPTPDA